MTSIPKRRKHRGGQRHSKLKRRRQAEREARVLQEQRPSAGGEGEAMESQAGTQLFERPQEIRSDIGLVRRAVNQRWQTDKSKAQAIIEKVQCQALGLPFINSEGVTEQPAAPYTPSQLIGAAKLGLDIEKQNQSEEHHQDKMEYYKRALDHRIKESAKSVQGMTINIGADGQSNPVVYIPHNFRDKVDEDTLVPDPFIQDGMAGESFGNS